MAKHTVRALSQLEKTASTARIWNLRKVFNNNSQNPEYLANPLFRNSILNRSIIVKHRLRDHERADFFQNKRTATKIIIPLDHENLNAGGQYAFVGQINFEKIMTNTLGDDLDKILIDLDILNVIDSCSSLDPFLLREHLAKQGINPAQCCFEIGESTNGKMLDFTKSEILPLVNKSVGQLNEEMFAEILSRKLLYDCSDDALKPLRETLLMDPLEFREGVFCWKAFLYYKWQLKNLKPRLPIIMRQISKNQPRGLTEAYQSADLGRMRRSLRRRMASVFTGVQDIIARYDRAYLRLIENNDPKPFKQFLLNAPQLFNALGERLAAIEHVSSYWTHRTGELEGGGRLMIDEILEMFAEFEQSLSFDAVVD